MSLWTTRKTFCTHIWSNWSRCANNRTTHQSRERQAATCDAFAFKICSATFQPLRCSSVQTMIQNTLVQTDENQAHNQNIDHKCHKSWHCLTLGLGLYFGELVKRFREQWRANIFIITIITTNNHREVGLQTNDPNPKRDASQQHRDAVQAMSSRTQERCISICMCVHILGSFLVLANFWTDAMCSQSNSHHYLKQRAGWALQCHTSRSSDIKPTHDSCSISITAFLSPIAPHSSSATRCTGANSFSPINLSDVIRLARL